MSEQSDDGFDRWLSHEDDRLTLLSECERDRTSCHWEPNDDGLMECRTCGKVVDL